MKFLDRRQFIQAAINSGILLSAGSFIPNSAFAQQEPDSEKLLLVLRFNGAWDTLLSMDARTKEYLNAASFSTNEFLAFDDRTSVKQYKDFQLGVSMEPLFKYLDDICIVNGILMNIKSSAHETNREYMASGNIATGSTYFPFALATAMQRRDLRVGYHMEYETLFDGNYENKVPTQNLNSFSDKIEDPYESVLDDDTSAASMQKSVIKQKRKEKDIIETLNKIISKTETSLATGQNSFKQASLALAGLGSGFLTMAQVDITRDGDLDTHNDHKNLHPKRLTEGFSHLAKMIKFMKETPYKLNSQKSLFDITTVVVTSEFARTASSDGFDGTGHNQYNNSCLLLGGNVKGGTIIGGSEIYKSKQLPNPSTVAGSLFHAKPFNFQAQRVMTSEEMKMTSLESFVL